MDSQRHKIKGILYTAQTFLARVHNNTNKYLVCNTINATMRDTSSFIWPQGHFGADGRCPLEVKDRTKHSCDCQGHTVATAAWGFSDKLAKKTATRCVDTSHSRVPTKGPGDWYLPLWIMPVCIYIDRHDSISESLNTLNFSFPDN